MVEVGSETFALFVRIFTDAPFDSGRPPVPGAKAGDPRWTSWRRHVVGVYPIELYTCPRVLGVGVSRAL